MIRHLVILAFLATRANAQSTPAPLPGAESGRIDSEPGDSDARIVARGALFLPRIAFRVALAPLEGAAWAYERFQLGDRAKRVFFTSDGTIGLVPTAALESGFGLNLGARFVDRDVFGAREHFVLSGSTGGRFHQRAALAFRSGDRLGSRMALDVNAEYERRPNDTFYGIGNADLRAIAAPIDPLMDDLASDATYRHRLARATATFDARVAGDLHVRGAGAIADHTFGVAETGPAIDTVYQIDRVVGFGGVRNAYGELELRYDSRRRASEWDPMSVPATGWLLAGFAGRVTALDAGATFWRYGFDAQRFVMLADGPRVLVLRTHAEAVTGETSQVPFIELPRLGGGALLRGYPVDRFRDRVAYAGTVEYQWDIARFFSASIFVDAGRVAPSVSDISVRDLRVGYGVSIAAHSNDSFVARATLASSVDGGVFLDLALDPVFEVAKRTERR